MNKREVVIETLNFRPPPYVPWAWDMTVDCRKRLGEHLGCDDLDGFVESHFLSVAAGVARTAPAGDRHVRDVYGTVWDRTVDKDIGTPSDWPIKDPADLDTYEWPDPSDPAWYEGIDRRLAGGEDRLRRYDIGFSLYERAWSMRGMTQLLMDMVDRPEFVERLMDMIVEHNLVQIHKALTYPIDMVHFGDDYGSQNGLIFGIEHWRHFIKPRLARMFAPVRDAGKYVSLHSCGCVDSLFDDLVEIGLNMFNPFQPEVMDIFALKEQYHGRLAFHGGMSIQETLPFGSQSEVQDLAGRLIVAGSGGGYVFAPSHTVPGDVSPQNLVAMMETLRAQRGYIA